MTGGTGIYNITNNSTTRYYKKINPHKTPKSATETQIKCQNQQRKVTGNAIKALHMKKLRRNYGHARKLMNDR